MEEQRKELERLYKQHGGLRPSAVVTAARNPESPLHSAFEWDDSVAAEQHRLWQARALIRKVRVIMIDNKEETIIHVPSVTVGEGEYLAASVVRGTPELYSRALAQAVSKLAAAQAAVDELGKQKKRNRNLKKASRLVQQARDAVASVQ